MSVWVVVDGPVRSGLRYETLLVPALLLMVYLTVRTVDTLEKVEREQLFQGLILLGTAHSVIAIGQAAASLVAEAGIPRADSLLGNSNALGLVLVATATLTIRELTHHRVPLLFGALALQLLAVLATGSRIAIVAALLPLGWYWVAVATPRAKMLILPWGAAAAAVFAVRYAQSLPDQRLQLWTVALSRIRDHPAFGLGPTFRPYDLPMDQARPTTHAHDEVLQWTVDYGAVGLALGLSTLVLAVRSTSRRGAGERLVFAAGISLLAGGLTDFSLRITAVVVVAAALMTCALLPPRDVNVSQGCHQTR
jgi:O-antigen ligase